MQDADKRMLVKVLDVGAPKNLARDHPRPVRATVAPPGMAVGRPQPQYMAPEQAMGGNVDERCDLFARSDSVRGSLLANVPRRSSASAESTCG